MALLTHWSPGALLDMTADDLRFWVDVLNRGAAALKTGQEE